MAESLPKPESGQALVERAESGTELSAEEVTEGQVLERENAARRASSAAAAREGSRLGQMLANRYRLERLIAKGGMGRVYLATQLPLERKVAVKLLVAKAYDEEFRQRFFLEASTCARLVHRHIVTVHDYGEAENGELFMAMEYLDGDPLSKVISRKIRLESDRACQVALQVCRALRTAHKSGIVHRDLKPGNVMLLRDEDQESADFVKVLDFGLVKAFENEDGTPVEVDLTRSGTWLGSPRYMAPEQIRCKDVDPRTDIYSLGVILFHMVAGRPPFIGSNSVEILEQHLRDPVPSIRELVGDIHYPPALEEIIRTCMAKDPADRYQSMDQVILDLKAAYRIATGVSIHTESSLPLMDLSSEAEADSNSSGGPSLRARPDTKLSRPPPVPALGPPPDLDGPDPSTPPGPPALSPPPLPSLDSASAGGPAPIDLTPLPGPATTRGRRKLWVLALVLLFVLLAGFAITRLLVPKPSAPAAAPAPLLLTVNSTPSGAQVVAADGRVLGQTPLVLERAASAEGTTERLTLRRAGYAAATVEADLVGPETTVQAKLTPLPAEPPEVTETPDPPKPASVAPAVTRRAPRRTTPRPVRRARPKPKPRPEPEPEPEPVVEEPPPPPVVVSPPPSRVGTVDERRGDGLVVDENEGATVTDRAVPVVD